MLKIIQLLSSVQFSSVAQSCPTLCDPLIAARQASLSITNSWSSLKPMTAAHQAPPSLGFSRQEHWSGLPFPSPVHGSEKWKWSHSVVSDSSQPRGLQPTRLLRPWDFPGKSTGVGCHCLLLSLPTPKPSNPCCYFHNKATLPMVCLT